MPTIKMSQQRDLKRQYRQLGVDQTRKMVGVRDWSNRIEVLF